MKLVKSIRKVGFRTGFIAVQNYLTYRGKPWLDQFLCEFKVHIWAFVFFYSSGLKILLFFFVNSDK